MNKKILKTVHDDDLEDVLKSLGVYRDFNRGELKCAFCKDIINWSNLHSLFPDSNVVKCCCSKPHCVKKLLQQIEKTKR